MAAGKGYEIGIGVDTKAFKQGVETGIVAPLDDAQQELTDLGRSKGPEELEQALRGDQEQTQKLAKETKQTAQAIEDEYRRAYRKMGDDADRELGRAGDAFQETKAQAIEAATEIVTEFDGTLDGVGSSIGGFASGIGGTLLAVGGVGAAVGAGLTVVGGLVEGVFSGMAEDAEASAERVEAAFNDMLDSGNKFVSESFLADRVAEILNDTELVSKAERFAERAGLPFETIVAAMAGYGSAAAEVREKVGDEIANLQAIVDEQGARYTTSERNKIGQLKEVLRSLSQTADEYNTAAQKAAAYEKITGSQTEAVADLNAELAKVPASTTAKVEVDTSDAERTLRDLERGRTLRLPLQLIDKYGRDLL